MTSITYPFQIDARGKISESQDPQKAQIDRVRAVLSTQFGDRVMRPDFGFDAESLIMDLDRIGQTEVQNRVQKAFQKYLPDLHLHSAQLSFGSGDSQTGTVLVEFTGPNGSVDSVSVGFTDGIVTLDPNSTP